MALRTLEELALNGKRVLVRADLDARVDGEGRVIDDGRIRAALPTIRWVLHAGGRLVLAAHRGHPTGKPEDARRYTLEPAAARQAPLSAATGGGTASPLAACSTRRSWVTSSMSSVERLRIWLGEYPFPRSSLKSDLARILVALMS